LAVFIDLVVNVAKTTAGHKKEKNLFFFHFVLVGYGLMVFFNRNCTVS
jgi:hypothetical protein